LLSCGAKPAPRVISIEVAENYRGDIHVATCATGTDSHRADQSGNVSVTDCPTGNQEVELAITRGAKIYRIPSNELAVTRTGDGIAVGIDAHLPQWIENSGRAIPRSFAPPVTRGVDERQSQGAQVELIIIIFVTLRMPRRFGSSPSLASVFVSKDWTTLPVTVTV